MEFREQASPTSGKYCAFESFIVRCSCHISHTCICTYMLQAELHYSNGRQAMAEISYQCSILSAREHRFYFEEALATELFGMYFVETKRVDEGLKHLVTAKEMYAKWGAMKKKEDLGNFIDMIKQPLSRYGMVEDRF